MLTLPNSSREADSCTFLLSGIENYEPFDGYLAEQAAIFHQRGITVVADDPGFDVSNYHGIAERYWGLLHADGSPKPAFMPFLNGMQTEAEAVAAAPPTGDASVTGAVLTWRR